MERPPFYLEQTGFKVNLIMVEEFPHFFLVDPGVAWVIIF
jgi:hypothetical protein